MRRVLPLFLIFAGCASVQPDAASIRDVELNQEFSVAVGETVNFSNSPYLLKLESVSEDSRCPPAVHCIWEGNAQLKVTLYEASIYPPTRKWRTMIIDDRTVTLNTKFPTPVKEQDFGLVVEFRRLEPAAHADTPTTPYQATLIVSKP